MRWLTAWRNRREGRLTMDSARAPSPLSIGMDPLDLGRVDDLARLLAAIDEAMPPDAVLYVEGNHFAPHVRAYLAAHALAQPPAVERGTLWPRSSTYHVPLAAGLAPLRQFAAQLAAPEVADHLLVYRQSDVLLAAYDASGGNVYAAADLPPSTIALLRSLLAAH